MPTLRVRLPTLHAAQAEVWRRRRRFNPVRCGRRWGKDVFMETVCADDAVKGRRAAIFAPEHKQLVEPFGALKEMLAPVRTSASLRDGIRCVGGGGVDFWHVNDNELAGRGREYDDVFVNEAAYTKSPMTLNEVWRKSIRPTLLVRRGRAWLLSTPAGIDDENLFYAGCNDPKLGFVDPAAGLTDFHYPTSTNPLISAEDFEEERRNNHPLVFQQEFLAEFVDWSGVAFFERDKLLVSGESVEAPRHCDAVLAVVDTAIKTGKENDGTGVSFWAYSRRATFPLVLLDWDLIQIEGSLLETWLPTVYQRLEALAAECGAVMGSLGAFIEDKGSGTILLQQAARRGWRAHAVDSKLTEMGKDERAISVSGYVYRGLVKFSRLAYAKVTSYKGVARNHMLAQVLGFRIGDKDAAKREDDLLDTFCYAVAVTLGDVDGY